jgi:hypothetical protein
MVHVLLVFRRFVFFVSEILSYSLLFRFYLYTINGGLKHVCYYFSNIMLLFFIFFFQVIKSGVF